MIARLSALAAYCLISLVSVTVLAATGLFALLWTHSHDLPDYRQLANYQPPTVTRVHAGNGQLIAEHATERRIFVPVRVMPRYVIQAFLAAEDKNFYSHPGIDFFAIIRATIVNIRNINTNRRLVGASTITQQVAKNFLLGGDLTFARKTKEMILAFRIENTFPKDSILELYLNEIYLGYGAHGVAAAALNYFDKSLGQLTLAEAAYLAALPKAPNNYHPVRQRSAAMARRNWVIGRMLKEGFIGAGEAEAALAEPFVIKPPRDIQFAEAEYFAEQVRRELSSRLGKLNVFEGGYSVRTTVSPKLQKLARQVLRNGLIAYDQRYGWRGPVAETTLDGNWIGRLSSIRKPMGSVGWRLATVLEVGEKSARVGFANGSSGTIPLEEILWARPFKGWGHSGTDLKRVDAILKPGHVVLVEAAGKSGENRYRLRQIPVVEGGLVAMDPHTGRVLAMVGGFDYRRSQFNRAVQAHRQPGSLFKPFVYLTALDNGYTPSTVILDAPIVIDQGPGLGKWKPSNFTQKFFGPSPMRIGIEKSRNLMTVRLAQTLGMEKIAAYAERFDITGHMPRQLSMALGAGETTLLRMTAAYSMLVNGGKRITPALIDRIQDRHGKTIMRHDKRACVQCRDIVWQDQKPPALPDSRKQIADPVSAYQIVSMLEGNVERGTGRRISTLRWPLAGKTGTTNKTQDAWFVGFSPDLAAGVYIGFDTPASLGRREAATRVAVPVFKEFMAGALKGSPAIPFRIPPGVRHVQINLKTGLPAVAGDKNVILESYRIGTEPSANDTRTVIRDWNSTAATETDEKEKPSSRPGDGLY